MQISQAYAVFVTMTVVEDVAGLNERNVEQNGVALFSFNASAMAATLER